MVEQVIIKKGLEYIKKVEDYLLSKPLHVGKRTINGRVFLVEEKVTDRITREMFLKIIMSPDGALDGFTTDKYGGKSSKEARN